MKRILKLITLSTVCCCKNSNQITGEKESFGFRMFSHGHTHTATQSGGRKSIIREGSVEEILKQLYTDAVQNDQHRSHNVSYLLLAIASEQLQHEVLEWVTGQSLCKM